MKDKFSENLTRFNSPKEIEEYLLKTYGDEIKEYTCFNCESKNECRYAYDMYNTNGDCLSSK
jgi:hypothetical protein